MTRGHHPAQKMTSQLTVGLFLAAGRDGDQRAPRDSSSTGGEKWEAMAAWTFWW